MHDSQHDITWNKDPHSDLQKESLKNKKKPQA